MREIREERGGEDDAVHAVHLAAFATRAEAYLVETLRSTEDVLVSLVATDDGNLVGHILFSPVELTGHPELRLMGLAPMAVLPERQREGIGSALVPAGLDACRRIGVDAVAVLGHPGFYPRFGFVPASRFGIDCEYDVPDDVFMAQELVSGVLAGRSGTIRYHEAFRSVG